MQKAINLEPTGNTIARVLSIADPIAAEVSPNGLDYILIEDYSEPPELATHMDIHYPLYNKAEGKFIWLTVNYQTAATETTRLNQELIFEISALKTEVAEVKSLLVEQKQEEVKTDAN